MQQKWTPSDLSTYRRQIFTYGRGSAIGGLSSETFPDLSPRTAPIILLRGSRDTVLRQIGDVYPFFNLPEIGGALVHALPSAAVDGMSERLQREVHFYRYPALGEPTPTAADGHDAGDDTCRDIATSVCALLCITASTAASASMAANVVPDHVRKCSLATRFALCSMLSLHTGDGGIFHDSTAGGGGVTAAAAAAAAATDVTDGADGSDDTDGGGGDTASLDVDRLRPCLPSPANPGTTCLQSLSDNHDDEGGASNRSPD